MTIVLTASEAQSNYDLTTLENAREFLQKQTGMTTGQDPLVRHLITRASILIQNQVGRQFVPTSGERSFGYIGGGRLDVGDVRNVTAVVYDSDGSSPATLTAGAWKLRPAQPSYEVYQSLYLPDYANDRRTSRRDDRVVTVTGLWGFAEVPADVEHACIVTVRDWLRSDVAFNPDGGVDRLGGDQVPPRVLAGLDHYRLPTV